VVVIVPGEPHPILDGDGGDGGEGGEGGDGDGNGNGNGNGSGSGNGGVSRRPFFAGLPVWFVPAARLAAMSEAELLAKHAALTARALRDGGGGWEKAYAWEKLSMAYWMRRFYGHAGRIHGSAAATRVTGGANGEVGVAVVAGSAGAAGGAGADARWRRFEYPLAPLPGCSSGTAPAGGATVSTAVGSSIGGSTGGTTGVTGGTTSESGGGGGGGGSGSGAAAAVVSSCGENGHGARGNDANFPLHLVSMRHMWPHLTDRLGDLAHGIRKAAGRRCAGVLREGGFVDAAFDCGAV
jgi:hypothetical protein